VMSTPNLFLWARHAAVHRGLFAVPICLTEKGFSSPQAAWETSRW
jgi:hypothetical protein